MTSLPNIYSFVSEISGVRLEKMTPNSDLFADLGIDGDDFFELEAEFEKRFSVDMSAYRWYFHHGEEGGPNIGGLFFSPPYRRVKRIPITPELLLASANAHRWPLEYPAHDLPSCRLDLFLNQGIFGAVAVAGLLLLAWSWLHA